MVTHTHHVPLAHHLSPGMQQSKSTKKSRTTPSNTSTPQSRGPQARPGGRSPTGSTPPAKKSLQYATPPRKMKAHATQSLPSTPIGIPSGHHRASSTPSPKTCFASAKKYEPPTPQSLPRPPSSWTGSKGQSLQAMFSSMQLQEQLKSDSRDTNDEVSNHLKLLLKVNA